MTTDINDLLAHWTDAERTGDRDHGDTTVVVARQHAAGEARGNPVPGDTRVSFLLVPDDGDDRTRIAGIQHSFMAPTGGEA